MQPRYPGTGAPPPPPRPPGGGGAPRAPPGGGPGRAAAPRRAPRRPAGRRAPAPPLQPGDHQRGQDPGRSVQDPPDREPALFRDPAKPTRQGIAVGDARGAGSGQPGLRGAADGAQSGAQVGTPRSPRLVANRLLWRLLLEKKKN